MKGKRNLNEDKLNSNERWELSKRKLKKDKDNYKETQIGFTIKSDHNKKDNHSYRVRSNSSAYASKNLLVQ